MRIKAAGGGLKEHEIKNCMGELLSVQGKWESRVVWILLMAFRGAETEQFGREDGHNAEQTCTKPQGAQRNAGGLLDLLSTHWHHQTASLERTLFKKHRNSVILWDPAAPRAARHWTHSWAILNEVQTLCRSFLHFSLCLATWSWASWT